ncbi:hypothetical protein TNCT_94431 [Trichonephila clavata]|uniref:Uncharacterized protein n=1 Tax=Trichonephila clavata TaxID=2740835 RepID=A0A8X6IGP8_TRICU|nr:hypothetical protein TNCT_94431 [Trichonephila clavata]
MLTDCIRIHRNPNQDIPHQFAHVPLGHSTAQQYRTSHSGHNIPTTGDSHAHSSRLQQIPPDGAADRHDVTARVFSGWFDGTSSPDCFCLRRLKIYLRRRIFEFFSAVPFSFSSSRIRNG